MVSNRPTVRAPRHDPLRAVGFAFPGHRLFHKDEIEQVAHQFLQDGPLRPPDGKTVIVVEASLKYGMVRMYDALTELEGIATETRPFYDMAETLQWLGKPIAFIPGLASPSLTMG